MSTFHVENFGCRATQADGASLERQFKDRGLTHAASADAEVVVLNTCTVTAEADRDARAAIRRVHRFNPRAKIVVTGCYAQRAPEEIAALPGVALVIGNSHKHQLADLALGGHLAGRAAHDTDRTKVLASQTRAAPDPKFLPLHILTEQVLTDHRPLTTGHSIYVSDIFAHTELIAAPVFDAPNSRTRPNLKVQDGCDNRCSFCVIPYVRGQSRSLRLDEILREASALVASGYRELVISGINLGRWGRDLTHPANDQRPATNEQRLASLIRAILAGTSLEKLRISSVEPMDWSDELIALVAESPRIAKHAHVPMQSGSDDVLRRMHRKYRPWHYREKVDKIRAAMPAAAIGADVMVGFPAETDAEFEATRRLIEDLPFTYLHVFTYSPRSGTPAADMRNQVPVHIARERNGILRGLAQEKKHAFMRGFVGQTLDAITLGASLDNPALQRRDDTGPPAGAAAPELFTEALTDNYLKLQIRGRHDSNQWKRVKIEEITEGALLGSIV